MTATATLTVMVTETSTVTMTATETGTPPASLTWTATPRVTVIPTSDTRGIPVVFPNPWVKGGEVTVDFAHARNAGQVELLLLTDSYRLISRTIFTGTYLSSRRWRKTLDLGGQSLANGLYYVVAKPSTGDPMVVKWAVLR